MQIFAINALKQNSKPLNFNNNQPYHIGSIALKEEDKPQSSGASPIQAYRDYNININFAGRKPEDFYAQEFIQRDMPDTMREYIAQNPEVVRSHGIREAVPPVQIMAESFNKLRYATTAEEVKALFLDEPLFADLKNPNYKTHHGIFSKIGVVKELLEESGVPAGQRTLFKNGLDNPVIYVLRKKYLECKTDSEIQADIARDINPHFALAAKEDGVYFPYSSLHNLGVQNPKLPFWNSLINTRDDYAHAYRDRIQVEGGKFVDADVARRRYGVSTKPEPVYDPSKNRYKPKSAITSDIGEMVAKSDAFNPDLIIKDMKRARTTKNSEELYFTQKYWSEIMSVATEKVHLSEELIKFNEKISRLGKKTSVNPVDTSIIKDLIEGQRTTPLTKAQTASLETSMQMFWRENPTLRKDFSTAISDTIQEFAQAFAENGENEEFKIMCEYAHSLKPEREARKAAHNLLQAEYDKLAFNVPQITHPEVDLIEKFKPAEPAKLKANIKESLPNGLNIFIAENDQPIPENMKKFRFFIDGHEVMSAKNPRVTAFELIKEQSPLMPERIMRAKYKELEEMLGKDFDKFCLSICFEKMQSDHELKHLLYSTEEIEKLLTTAVSSTKSVKRSAYEALCVAVMEYGLKTGLLNEKDLYLAHRDHAEIRHTLYQRMYEAQWNYGQLGNATLEIDNIAKKISAPVTNAEKNKISIELIEYLRNIRRNLPITDNVSFREVLQTSSIMINDMKDIDDKFKSIIRDVVNDAGMVNYEPCMKYILNKDGISELKNAQKEYLLSVVFNKEKFVKLANKYFKHLK